MQRWVLICAALLSLVGADKCPDAGRCENGQTCCKDPVTGYECCPFDEAECCGDHVHCCPTGTTCDTATSSCVNATVSVPWAERASADQPRVSKSFRMIKSNMLEDDDNICPDQSRCPPEFSCLKALTKFGCCPLAQGVPCADGKHCCSEGHQCSADSRSCIKKEVVTTVLCSDGVSECPDETTCCETPEGKWGCCPMAKAVCCDDKIHCCPEGSTCDIEHSKCISSTNKKEMPMWAKLPARMRAEWENQKEGEQVTSKTVDDGNDEKSPEVTTVSPSEGEVTVAAAGNDVPCNDTAACPDGTTCCKTKEGGFACCPLPEAVCCEDLIHCCPKGKKCNLAEQTCDDDTCSVKWLEKVPTVPRRRDVQARVVTCDTTFGCPDGSTCCKNKTGGWACCPLEKATCCDDHEHCCPSGTTCDLTTLTCNSGSGSEPMRQKMPAFISEATSTANRSSEETSSQESLEDDDDDDDDDDDFADDDEKDEEEEDDDDDKDDENQMDKEDDKDDDEDEDEEEEENKAVESLVQCDIQTTCPQSTTCCFMSSTHKWGCCPLPEAVCCRDGNHCCPQDYKCNEDQTTCIKGEVEIPWYTKLPATSNIQAHPSAEQCDDQSQCPEHTTCCRLATGNWACCPLPNAVCCPDKEHCCPQGYTCNISTNACWKIILLQSVPLTPVFLPEHLPQLTQIEPEVECDEQIRCRDRETCCKISTTAWGCCPYPNGKCCSDMQHCCPTGYTCTRDGGCTQDAALHWNNWRVFLANKKRALIV